MWRVLEVYVKRIVIEELWDNTLEAHWCDLALKVSKTNCAQDVLVMYVGSKHHFQAISCAKQCNHNHF